jgi:hypothetical protein
MIMEMNGLYNIHGRDEMCTQNFGVKPEGKRAIGRSGCREDKPINIDLRETGY